MVLFCPLRVRSSESTDGGRHMLEAVLSVAGEGSIKAKEEGAVEGCARTHPQRHW